MTRDKTEGAPAPSTPVHQIVGLQHELMGGPPAEDAPEIVSTEELEVSGWDELDRRVVFNLVACRLADGRRVIDSEGMDKLTMFITSGGGMLVSEQDKVTQFVNGLDLGNAGLGPGKLLTL